MNSMHWVENWSKINGLMGSLRNVHEAGAKMHQVGVPGSRRLVSAAARSLPRCPGLRELGVLRAGLPPGGRGTQASLPKKPRM